MTQQESLSYWPKGYFDPGGITGRGHTLEQIADTMIRPFMGGITVEIGPGGGTWSNLLASASPLLIAVDVVPKSSSFETIVTAKNVAYAVVPPTGILPTVRDSSVGFVWSYDVFCHLPFRIAHSYFLEFGRILKRGGTSGIMFPCFDRHPDLKNSPRPSRNEMNGMHWFDYSATDIAELTVAGGLTVVNADVFPDNRDRLVLFRKP